MVRAPGTRDMWVAEENKCMDKISNTEAGIQKKSEKCFHLRTILKTHETYSSSPLSGVTVSHGLKILDGEF
jgi:hypothetical protein